MNCTPNVRQNIRGDFMSKYSFEEKCEAVQRVLDGMSICESARILGVGVTARFSSGIVYITIMVLNH